ncbi:phage tail tip lysozyme [Lactococcus insecticola]|uniref:LysM peptidoglycan-binding domain-containing protein n=1 Tax=Pseudolactococcus insecticola TaxID=2709158 RepID=A0A6A0B4Y7_9LACT|nr:phage tail tip lysozyme [Lactococcus insecticola]GFH40449.1 hypothetical protein Hs20B_08470 [Lactococcus insecticola]
MGKHEQPNLINTSKNITKVAIGVGTVGGVLTLTHQASAETYTVKAGDTLSTIAQTYKTTADELLKINNSQSSDLAVGQTLETSAPAPKRVTTSVPPVTYTVKAGDTLWDIAQAHNTTVDALANNSKITDPQNLVIGQEITITPASEKVDYIQPTVTPAVLYTVQSGDTLESIAASQQVSVDTILKNSGITDPNTIYVGQFLIIKQESVSYGDTASTGAISATAKTIATKANISEQNAQNALDIAKYLTSQEGFTLQGAAGALAVAERESGFNPEAVNTSGGVAGIFQWSGWSNTINGNRWARAEAKKLTLDVQLKLVSTELNSNFKNVKTLMSSATDAKQASLDWSQYYEGVALTDSQTQSNDLQANAQKWFEILSDGAVTTTTPAVYYVVQSGDTLGAIAQKYNVSISDIVTNSGISNANAIAVGQKLTIKAAVTSLENTVSDASSANVPLDVNNGPYTSNNTYAAGNCTWYVKDVFKTRMGDYWGNAKDWAASASREGLLVDGNPVANKTIAVFAPGSAGADATYGHVAVVIGVSGDTVTISEMNAVGLGKISTREIPKSAATYIHMDY